MPSRTAQTARQFVQYHQRVLETRPIVYWLLDEKQGAVAYDWVAENGAQNGAHTGITPYQPGIGDGFASPYYDGVNDYTNIHTATFIGRFDGAEGTLVLWTKVGSAGVWTDGTDRRLVQLRVDIGNRIYISKTAANNTIDFVYQAGGTVETVALTSITALTWMCFALTWSKSAGASGEVKAYYNGAQTGATQVGLGVWVGALNNAVTCLGAGGTGPFNPFDGYVAHGAIWNRALAPDAILRLYNAGMSH